VRRFRAAGRWWRGALAGGATTLGLAVAAEGLSAQQPVRDAGEAKALAILEAAAARYGAAAALCADFRQQLSVPLLGEERTGAGRLCQEQPDHFAMRFTDPPGDAVVVDGTALWIYYPSIDPRQVLRLPVAAGEARGLDLHREFLSDPGTKYAAGYRGTEDVDGRPAHVIRLTPKAPATYRAATVWIDVRTSVLRRVRIEEENGNVRTVTLDHVRFDPEIPADFFTFTPPAGAHVIRR